MDVAIRSFVAFLFVFAVTRVVGRRERLTVEEVEAEARLQQIASLRQVRWAVLETNGKISFVPDEEDTPSVFADE